MPLVLLPSSVLTWILQCMPLSHERCPFPILQMFGWVWTCKNKSHNPQLHRAGDTCPCLQPPVCVGKSSVHPFIPQSVIVLLLPCSRHYSRYYSIGSQQSGKDVPSETYTVVGSKLETERDCKHKILPWKSKC